MVEENYILLERGSLKGWNLKGNDEALAILKKWIDLGLPVPAITHRDIPEQKELLCELIRTHHGVIENDWDGIEYTKEQAIDYIMDYSEAKQDDDAQDQK